MKLLNTALTGIISGSLALTAFAADEIQLEGAKPGHWTMDYDAAVKLAAEKKLPLLLNFTGSDWCGWCKIMDKNVFAGEGWKSYAAENAVLVTIDFPKKKDIVPEKYVERNNKLKEQFKVGGFPTYMIIDSDGKSVLGQLGAGKEKTPESFIKEFKSVARLSAANMAAYAKENPSKARAFKAAIEESKAAEKALKDWIATRPTKNDENTKLFKGFNERIKAAAEALEKF